MAKIDNLVRDLTDTLRNSNKKKTSSYDSSATVTRIDGDTAWVHIPGGVDETPVKRTINANRGDEVQVRVSGGKAWIVGNATNPPTDDRTAIKANQKAIAAYDQAIGAQESAIIAAEAADSAQKSAEIAHGAADSALGYANNALTQLSIVEDVSGTLNWIKEHGTYVATTDTTVKPDTIYFETENNDYVPIANPDPTANPASEGWYVLDITDSQTDYIMAHLAVTSAGLWVLPSGRWSGHPIVDNNGNVIVDSSGNPIVDWTTDPQSAASYKVLLSASGMTVFDDRGIAVASYGVETVIGKIASKHVRMDDDSLDIMDGDDVIAEFGEKAVVGKRNSSHAEMASTDFSIYMDNGQRAFSVHKIPEESLSQEVYVSIEKYFCASSDASKAQLDFDLELIDYGVDGLSSIVPYVFANGTKLPNSSEYYEYSVLVDQEEDSVTGETTITSVSLAVILYPTYSETSKFEEDDYIRICLPLAAMAMTFGYRRTGSIGPLSFSCGTDNLVSGDRSTAFGIGLISEYPYQFVMGEYNENKWDNRFEIGLGAADDERANIFEVDNDGNVNAAGTFKSGGDYFIATQSFDLGVINITGTGTPGTTFTTISKTITKTGYTPIAVKIRFTSTAVIGFNAFFNSDSTGLYVQVIRRQTGAISTNTHAYADVTYVKN